MKKFLFTLSVCLTALFLSFTVSADSVVKITESAKDNVVLDESNEKVREVVKKYFELYYTGLDTLEIPDFSEIMEDNDGMLKNKKSIEFWIKLNEYWDSRQINQKITLEYFSFENTLENSIVKVLVSGEYNYSDMPPEVDSGFAGLHYEFTINKENKIINIETDDDTFTSFDVNIEWFYDDSESSRGTKTYEEKLDDVIKKGVDRMKTTDVEIETKNVPEEEEDNSDETVVEPYSVSVTYNNMLGRNYAQKFANAKSKDETWFYFAEKDCTNFVSQCVWAAYGGYVEGSTSETATMANIQNQYRMTDTWYAGTGGGSSNWENVTSFWDYMTANKDIGPKATGYNNNGAFDNVSASSIKY